MVQDSSRSPAVNLGSFKSSLVGKSPRESNAVLTFRPQYSQHLFGPGSDVIKTSWFYGVFSLCPLLSCAEAAFFPCFGFFSFVLLGFLNSVSWQFSKALSQRPVTKRELILTGAVSNPTTLQGRRRESSSGMRIQLWVHSERFLFIFFLAIFQFIFKPSFWSFAVHFVIKT